MAKTPTRRAPFHFVSTVLQRSVGGFPVESFDCTVRALSLVTGISYQDAHIIMNLGGREPLHGANLGDGLRVGQQLGSFRYKKISLVQSQTDLPYGNDTALF